MSFAALAWAAAQRPSRSAEKLLLLALADRHNTEENVAYPSVAWLADFTGLNRKTVITTISRLEEAKYLEDTGRRVGATLQVKAYRLCFERGETVPKITVPIFPKSPNQESRKRDTEPVKEPNGVSNDTPIVDTPVDELDLGLPPVPSPDPTPAEVGEAIEKHWAIAVQHFGATALRGGKVSEANAEKARDLGKAHAIDGQTAINVWTEIWARIGESHFLQGKVPGRDGRPPFKLTLGFLLEKRNFVKALEGRFGGQSTGERKRGSTSEATSRVVERIRTRSNVRSPGRNPAIGYG